MKTHYDGFINPQYTYEEEPQAYCGTTADELQASNKWNEVTCKKCLKLKDRAIYERQLIEVDIVKQMGEMVDFNIQYDHHQEAMSWWDNLTVSEKRNYEYQTYGDGEYWEDNTLHEDDIVLMYNKFHNETL